MPNTRKSMFAHVSPPAARTVLNLAASTRGFLQGMEADQPQRLDPELTPKVKPLTEDRMGHSGNYNTLELVVEGLSLPDPTREKLKTELRKIGTGKRAVHKARRIIMDLARSTRDPVLAKEVAIRFTAYATAGGLVKSAPFS